MVLFLITLSFLAYAIRNEQILELGEEEFLPDYSYDVGKIKKVKCKRPNTKRSAENKCICNDEYLGDPNSTHGCFKCEPGCSDRAECVFPGNCVCVKGFTGNNNSVCSEPTPFLVSIQNHSQFYVKIKYELDNSEFKPFYAACKFNSKSSSAMLNEDNSISCFIPREFVNFNSNVNIVISFNGKEWSNSFVYFLKAIDPNFLFTKNESKFGFYPIITINNLQVLVITIAIALVSIMFV